MNKKYRPECVVVKLNEPEFYVDSYCGKTEIKIYCASIDKFEVKYESYGYDLDSDPVNISDFLIYMENKKSINSSIQKDATEVNKLNNKIEDLKQKLSECRKERDLLAKVIEIKK
jgi:hypothetical protein